MKKRNKILCTLLFGSLIAPCAFMMSACAEEPQPEEHKVTAEWSTNETYHWHACTVEGCEETYDKAEHDYENFVCKVCNYIDVAHTEAFVDNGQNKVYYATFKDAMSNAQNGDSIGLLKNITTDATITISKSLTIDGQNKYSIKTSNTFAEGSMLISVPNDNNEENIVTLTLKNVTIDANNKGRAIVVSNEGLVVDGATIKNGNAGSSYIGGVYMTDNSIFRMTSGKITDNTSGYTDFLKYANDLWIGSEAVAEISGGTIGSMFVNSNSVASPTAQTTITGGNITNVYVEYDTNCAAKLVYQGGTITNLLLSTTTNGTYQTITNPATNTYIGGQGQVDTEAK